MENEPTAVETTGLAVLDEAQPQPMALTQGIMALPPAEMAEFLEEYSKRRATFREWLLSNMEEGVHYGYPPGTEPKGPQKAGWKPKKSLYKAGAELVCDLLQLRPEFVPDLEAWQMAGSKPGMFCYRCQLVHRHTGEIIGEGRGACSSGGSKTDNNAIKMAQKSSKVDAVINSTALSDLVTQDLEDMPAPSKDTARSQQPKPAARATAPATQRKPENGVNYQGMAFAAATSLWGAEVTPWAVRWHCVAYGGDGTAPSWTSSPEQVRRKTALHLAAVEKGEESRPCSVCRLAQMARDVVDGFGATAMEAMAQSASAVPEGETPTAKAILGSTYEAFQDALEKPEDGP